MSDDAHDVGAEQSLLGSVLVAPDMAGPILLTVPPEAWWSPKHATLAAALTDRLRAGEPVDPQLVLIDVVGRIGFGNETGPYLATLMERAWVPANADHYAHRIMRCAARRNLSQAAVRVRQQLDESWANGWDEGIAEFTRGLRDACDRAEVTDAGVDMDEPSMSLAELLAGEDTHDWLVPGLLERGERILLTGEEGGGKSYLTSQLAACLAAGVHPFTGNVLGSGGHGLRVLVVDAENSAGQSRRRFRRIADPVDAILRSRDIHPAAWRENLRLEVRPAGLDVLGQDAAWLERKVAANAPDLLVVGPLYRLTNASMNEEGPVRQLLAVMDGLRTRYGCALLTEAHAGHEKDGLGQRRWRPAGSSLFLRWPEFGFGLARSRQDEGDENPTTVDVVAWRGSREQRQWPTQLRHSRFLPWMPADESYFADAA